MNLNDLTRHNKTSIKAAGPRYTPGLDPNAPNIEIDHLVEAICALSLSDGFRDRLKGLKADVESEYERNRYALGGAFRSREITPGTLIQDVEQFASRVRPHAVKAHARKVLRRARHVVGGLDRELERIDRTRTELRAGDDDKKKDEKLRSLDNRRVQITRLRSAVQSIRSFVGGTGRLATTDQAIMLLGTWGTGKTHLMCDVAAHRFDGSVPVLLFLASTLDGESDVLDSMATSSGLATSGTELLRESNSLGAAAGRRALLLIDGINEGDHDLWRQSLASVARRVSEFKHLGLVVTCRRPYERQLVTDAATRYFVDLEHWGFADQEFDVQLEFFEYYGLEAPEVPLITSEFSNPLFLKLFCNAIQELSARSQRRKFHEIASGQKTMNYIFEYFAKRVGRPIEVDFGLQGPAACWQLLKSFAEQMVEDSTESLPLDVAVALASVKFTIDDNTAGLLIERMAAEGLLIRQMRWRDDDQQEEVHFPFQRFGDHLIARYLLKESLNAANDETVRRSFYANRPLGRVFKLDQWGREFSSPGLAEALMVEFPERVRRAAVSSSELARFLPRSRRYASPLASPFLDGLYWRNASSFGDDTDHLISFFLGLDDVDLRARTFDTLVGLSARPGHPYSADRLQRYLFNLDMPVRDLQWSEYLRQSDDDGPFHRVLAWADTSSSISRGQETIANDIKLLELGLTTTVRPLRDRITQALVQLGRRSPRSLFSETVASLECNDPYVPERMLAASYGVAMQLWSDPQGRELRKELTPFARQLARLMLLPGAQHATSHTLMRDYATGIIELALLVEPRSIATRHLHYVRTPADSCPCAFIDPAAINLGAAETNSGALHMDFENYTLGRLVRDRSNYDMQHNEYQQVRLQILRRMQDLGYASASFDDIDKRIAEYNWRADDEGKTDRYGKKYSWIAYFEMYGHRSAHGLLEEWRADERTSDCDVDPSFPGPAEEWTPDLPDNFSDSPTGKLQWLRDGPDPDYDHLLRQDEVDGHTGPWVLLDAHINQDGSHSRQLFTFIQVVMAPGGSVSRIREYVESREYLGNGAIPSAAEDYYTYAGEVPWSRRFSDGRRLAGGGARRHLEPMIDRFRNGRWESGLIVEVPSHEWSWESHHSVLNQTSGVRFPAPALCEALGLVNHFNTFDLFDRAGRRASIFRKWPPERGSFFGSHILYLREDLLQRYLRDTGQKLIWVSWGERNHRPSEVDFSSADTGSPSCSPGTFEHPPSLTASTPSDASPIWTRGVAKP